MPAALLTAFLWFSIPCPIGMTARDHCRLIAIDSRTKMQTWACTDVRVMLPIAIAKENSNG